MSELQRQGFPPSVWFLNKTSMKCQIFLLNNLDPLFTIPRKKGMLTIYLEKDTAPRIWASYDITRIISFFSSAIDVYWTHESLYW